MGKGIPKQNIPINFSQGLDTKTDPFQVDIGKFLNLQNMVFTKGKLLTKRNGFPALAILSASTYTFLTTYKESLTAIGTSLATYSAATQSWINKGSFVPLTENVVPLYRSNLSQTFADSSVSPNGLVCTVFTDNVISGGGTAPSYKYIINNVENGQNIVAATVITSTGTVTYAPRVFQLGRYFIIVFDTVISATNHLQYIAINITTLVASSATDISTQYTPHSTGAFDGVVANNNLYITWNGSDGGGAIRVTYIDQTLIQHNVVAFTGKVATIIGICADTTGTTPVIYIPFYNGTNVYIIIVNQALSTILGITVAATSVNITNISGAAQNGICTVVWENLNIGFNHFINKLTVTSAGVISGFTNVIRSLGLASKPFIIDGVIYVLGVYESSFQPTYFLVSTGGTIIAKLAYSNGGGLYVTGLPSVTVIDSVAYMAYLFKDLITAVNKTQGLANSAGIYSQTGINLAAFTFGSDGLGVIETGNDLHISGGFLWMFDGSLPVEHGFHLWPDTIVPTVSHSGGSMIVQDYYYAATYEWSDAQGNIFRSAPSIPVIAASASFSGSSNSVSIDVPTLRLTAKTVIAVKIVLYRWSTAQPNYYQCTSVSVPLLNNITVDTVTFVDTQTDAQILGNNLIYTTGGVIENIAAPATSSMTLFKSRLMLLDAEDKNLIWYSKQVIKATPVEMSDLLTIFIPPTIGAQGNTGIVTSQSAMDDKYIVYKKTAIYYLTGNGPDNTGANNDFSEPIFITSTVGCTNQNSIVQIPQGLMFQDGTGKGIWLLGRDLNTTYIGKDVEIFNSATVLSAVCVPGTNQARFTLDNGVTLMYDYYFGQWGTFAGIPAISSTIYQNLHTYINSFGLVFQESLGTYLDGSNPVLMAFTTSWINLTGLQGFERAYEFYFLGTYISPHKLNVQIAYDYNASPTQFDLIVPTNYNGAFGSDPLFGGSGAFGGNLTLEQFRIFFQRQKCQAFQIIVNEVFDYSFGVVAGAGLTLSGLNLTVGMKGTRPKLTAIQQVG